MQADSPLFPEQNQFIVIQESNNLLTVTQRTKHRKHSNLISFQILGLELNSMPLNHLSNNFFHINLTLSQKHNLEQISRPTSAFSSKYQIARICNVFLERMNWLVGKIGFARAKRIRSIFTTTLRLLSSFRRLLKHTSLENNIGFATIS